MVSIAENSSLSSPTLLLVHGAWHGAWCWEDKFAPYLRQKGLAVETFDLPGHGKPGSQRIGMFSIRDYTDCVASKLAEIDGSVVVAGHSMGGFVTQKLLERRPQNLAGAALIAAATPLGVLGVVGHLIRYRFLDFLWANLSLNLYYLVRKPELAYQMFNSPNMPKEEAERNWQKLSSESYRAFIDMLGLDAPVAKRADPALPKWVVGGELDVVFPPKVVNRTADAYGVNARIYDGMGHNLMQDPGWESVADDLFNWIMRL